MSAPENKNEDVAKAAIFKFVLARMDDFDLERCREMGDREDETFASLADFRQWNKDCIDKLTSEQVECVQGVMQLIQKKQLSNMDKEGWVVFPSSGFFWNREGQMVVFNER